jgi:hypothetical protein
MDSGDIAPHTAHKASLSSGGCSEIPQLSTHDQQVIIAIPLTPSSKNSYQTFNSEPFFLPKEIRMPIY